MPAPTVTCRAPAGYETILSPEYEGGRDLSVGQWQRVALARAFIRDAPLIILDEPTASLDPRAEHDLFPRIRYPLQGTDSAPHLAPVQHRSRRRPHLRARPGRIIEHGSHDQLIAQAGTYAELFTLQAAAYTDTPSRNGHRANELTSSQCAGTGDQQPTRRGERL